MMRRHSVRAAIGLLLFGLFGCETVLGLSTTDPTLMEASGQAGAAGQAGGQAGAAGQAGNLGTSGTSGTSAGAAGAES